MGVQYNKGFKRQSVEAALAMEKSGMKIVVICEVIGINTSMLRKWKILYEKGELKEPEKKVVEPRSESKEFSYILKELKQLNLRQSEATKRLDAISLCMEMSGE